MPAHPAADHRRLQQISLAPTPDKDACCRDDGQPYGRQHFDWTNSSIPTEELN